MKRKTIGRLIALLPLPITLVLRLVASGQPEAVERVFSTGLYPKIAAPVSRLMALCPVPVVELLLIGLFVFTAISLYKRRFFRTLVTYLLIAAIFFGGWSMNYLRLPLEETLGLPVAPSSTEELTALSERLVSEANAAHAESMDNPLSHVPAALDAASADWPIPSGGFAAPKYALSSPILTRLLIEGIASPFTLEGLVNGQIPEVSKPFAACHEGAHIRGFAREEDASLVGYLACLASAEPFFRYSGTVTALLYTLSALRDADRAAYDRCRALLSEPVLADLAAHTAFWAPYEQTKPAEISTAVNDAYLQTVSGGEQSVRSYGRLVDLLLALERKEAITP